MVFGRVWGAFLAQALMYLDHLSGGGCTVALYHYQ